LSLIVYYPAKPVHRPAFTSTRRPCTGVLLRLRRAHELIAHALAAFVVTFVAAPCLHNLNHRADHVHTEAGVVHVHHDQGPAAKPSPTQVEVHRTQPPHGRGSLAHFGAAVLATAVFVVPPPWVRTGRLEPALPANDHPRTPPRGLPSARGPPV
jgi:hypothetical protein